MYTNLQAIKIVKYIILAVLWTIIGLYVTASILSHIPAVQSFIANRAAEAATSYLDTEVSLGKIQLGYMNRVIIDDISINDRKGKPMLKASRFSLKMNPFSLLSDNIDISSSQLFGAEIFVNKDSASAELNCQFLIDILSSKDDSKEKQGISINSFVVRRGSLKYDCYSAPEIKDKFDANHMFIKDISGHILLNKDIDDNLNVKLKKLSFREKSGINVKRLSFRLANNDKETNIENFILDLTGTSIKINNASASYKYNKGKLDTSTLKFSSSFDKSIIVLSDFSSVVPLFRNFSTPLLLNTEVSGTYNTLSLENFTLNSSDKRIDIKGTGSLKDFKNPTWQAVIEHLIVNQGTINTLKENFGNKDNKKIEILSRLGDISIKGKAHGNESTIGFDGSLDSDAGTAILNVQKQNSRFKGHAHTKQLDLGRITSEDDFGTITAKLDFDGSIKPSSAVPDVRAKGVISEVTYMNHIYKDISIDGSYINNMFDGTISIDDPDASLTLNGEINYFGKNPSANFDLNVKRFRPYALGLTKQWKDADFYMNVSADIKGKDPNTARGYFNVSDFSMQTTTETLCVDNFALTADNQDSLKILSLRSDFADADIKGRYRLTTLKQSFTEILNRILPSSMKYDVPSTPSNNTFDINVKLKDANWLRMFWGVPVSIDSPILVKGNVSDKNSTTNLQCQIPQITYEGSEYTDGQFNIKSDISKLNLDANLIKTMGNGHKMYLYLDSDLKDGKLISNLYWNNNNENVFCGNLCTIANFLGDNDGKKQTQIQVRPSEMTIGGVKWYVRPSTVTLGKKDITINNFVAENDKQHLIINGRGTDNAQDSIIVNMQDMEVAYILDLVNFHSVKFSGKASGTAVVSSLFSKPKAYTDIKVDDFRFQGGRMGSLYANVKWNDHDEQIEIDALSDDLPTGTTRITGYVSPKRNYLWLNLGCNNMRAEFLEGFCGSFMENVTSTIKGNAVVGGPLNRVNLMGDLVLTGGLGISSTNTNYYLDHVNVHCEEDLIQITDGKMSDATGGKGLLNGKLGHRSFTKLKYDVQVDSEGLPMYNTDGKNGDTFYGTIYIDGRCRIHGLLKDVMIDVDATPVKESFMVYDASAPDAINNRNFITWKTDSDSADTKYEREELYNATDIHMNMNVDATNDLMLKVLMDKESGDNIELRGEGALRATYYNKGPFNMFGTYNVRQGNYRLTIQNILEKNFSIKNGSRIVFSGDPYAASLNLNATHTVNGVSLSDLKIGKSFSNNTIRVNCIMGIKGTPEQPRVDFDIEMPTVDSEVQQMIRNMITTEEDMNRQVVYILGIGRFYVPEDSNIESENGPSQTSLAMQSLLSGTISSQINSLIGRIVNSKQWNFGANISTGDEGWNNAEYEGIISGHMLNNRLLVNGQFGYRDNANATTGFIGDFDIRYLLYPNGNFAVRLYNQTNDRYFTKSSLNTQGVGLILKKDFWNLKDLLGLNRKKDKKKKDEPERSVIREGDNDNVKTK